jgi:hypothetical protein
MKRFLATSSLTLLSGLVLSAATTPLFINSSPVPPAPLPQIDATAWVNSSAFSVSAFGAFGQSLPYESQNTLFFTNTPPAITSVMFSDPGFRFVLNKGSAKYAMDSWINHGAVTVDHSLLLTVGDPMTSALYVRATNIVSTGPLQASAEGIIRLEGKKINLTRDTLLTGSFGDQGTNLVFFGGFLGLSNYVNAFGVSDVYWAYGTNNALDGRGGAMSLTGPPGIDVSDPTCPGTPLHAVIEPSLFGGIGSGFLFTNFTSLPTYTLCSFGSNPGFPNFFGSNFNFGRFATAVNTNPISQTSRVVQVVFYPTNGSDPNFTTDVQFVGGFFGPASVVVGFHSADFDIVSQQLVTNSVFLTDDLAVNTNRFLAKNMNGNTQRPDTYEITRSSPFFLGGVFGGSSPGNATFTSTLLYDPATFQYNAVTNVYTAYSARVSSIYSPFPAFTALVDSTNLPGRVDIVGEEVNLTRTRIRSQASVNIRATNLTSNRLAQVDAPFINFDVGSTAPVLVISNLAPLTVRRLSGPVAAWSGVWDNIETNLTTTNFISFHVLIVDHALQSETPVTVDRFAAKATNVVIRDVLRIGKGFRLDANGVEFASGGGLQLPTTQGLNAGNLLNVYNFTNNGFISAFQEVHFGDDRFTNVVTGTGVNKHTNTVALPYTNFVNRGTNTAPSMFVHSLNVLDTGCLNANGGVLSVEALTLALLGGPTFITTNVSSFVVLDSNNAPVTLTFTNTVTNSLAAKLSSSSLIRIAAGDLLASNSLIQAGDLIISVTNSLRATNPAAPNFWSTEGGIDMLKLPTTSDLLGTYLTSYVLGFNEESVHRWPALDLGATVAGFNNNLALGKLTLNGVADNTAFRFTGLGVGGANALYVDYLELLGNATNYSGPNVALSMDPDITVYFANANIPPEKLDGTSGGQLRWVRDFCGPLSSTNFTILFTNGVGTVTSNTFCYNTALVTSKDIDSDGDGIVNAEDDDPFNERGRMPILSIDRNLTTPFLVSISWNAQAGATNILEYKSGMSLTNWQVLTNVVTGPNSRRVTVSDLLSTEQQRSYRVRALLPAP